MVILLGALYALLFACSRLKQMPRQVALMFGSGILGLGHHYFWIGTPEYWLSIGGLFSALEPIPLVAMAVHAVYDAGTHKI